LFIKKTFLITKGIPVSSVLLYIYNLISLLTFSVKGSYQGHISCYWTLLKLVGDHQTVDRTLGNLLLL